MARSLTLVLTSCLLAFLSWALLLGHRHYNASPRARERPNIVFIFTDDQDAAMDSLAYMPFVQTHITDHGISYLKHFCTVALCCPSRATVWSGQAAHNTNVTELAPPYGGYPKWVQGGYNEQYLATWMQAAGYGTYYVGKFMNSQSLKTYNKPHAAGWTGSDFLLDPYTYCYTNSTFQRNRELPASHQGRYSTDVIAEKTFAFLDDALKSLKQDKKPFFLTTAPIAPHGTVCPPDIREAPIAAERHRGLFADVIVPRTMNFNPKEVSGAQWVANLARQNDSNVEWNDEYYRQRLRALQSVDEMVDGLVRRLDNAGVLQNTYIFFSTDNGFHIGQHRMQPGKQSPYEEDLRVPMIVRGPGLTKGAKTAILTSHVDLAPTFLALAEGRVLADYTLDGQVMPFTQPEDKERQAPSDWIDWTAQSQEQVNVEHWGIHIPEGKYGTELYDQNTYKAVRIVSPGINIQYTVWCTGEKELYDLDMDPYQMKNLAWENAAGANHIEMRTAREQVPAHPQAASLILDGDPQDRSTTVARIISRVDALLLLLKDCKGRQCTHPWRYFFPTAAVRSLSQAMAAEYDNFFQQNLSRVAFECTKGYIPEQEEPRWQPKQVFVVDEVWLDES